jgi:hypothetical protein
MWYDEGLELSGVAIANKENRRSRQRSIRTAGEQKELAQEGRGQGWEKQITLTGSFFIWSSMLWMIWSTHVWKNLSTSYLRLRINPERIFVEEGQVSPVQCQIASVNADKFIRDLTIGHCDMKLWGCIFKRWLDLGDELVHGWINVLGNLVGSDAAVIEFLLEIGPCGLVYKDTSGLYA